MDVSFDTGNPQDHLRRVWRLCCGCAEAIYGTVPPSPAYALRTARLLFMTGAQESGFAWERQRTPRWEGNTGGFSKWQVEPGSIQDSVAWLQRRPGVLERATRWLFDDPRASLDWPGLMGLDGILWAMRLDDNDKIGLLFARVHYLRVPAPIPDSDEDQAAYYKQFYNTELGAATVSGTLDSFRRFRGMLAAPKP